MDTNPLRLSHKPRQTRARITNVGTLVDSSVLRCPAFVRHCPPFFESGVLVFFKSATTMGKTGLDEEIARLQRANSPIQLPTRKVRFPEVSSKRPPNVLRYPPFFSALTVTDPQNFLLGLFQI